MPRATKPCNMNPVPPVASDDDRPAICDLLKTHAKDVESVRTIVSKNNPLYNTKYHDDLWILRFLLSHRKPAKAAKAALGCMAYRSKHGLDELEETGWLEARTEETVMPTVFQPYSDHMENDAIFHSQPHKDRGVFVYVQPAGIDMTQIVNEGTKDKVRGTMRITNEFYFRVLDETTRRTGRLTKMIRVMDLKGLKLTGLNRTFLKTEGQVAKEIEDFYPQQLASVFVFNALEFVTKMFKVLKYLIPPRTRGKIDIFSPQTCSSLPKDSPIFQHVSSCDLPERYGGTDKNWPPKGSSGPPDSTDFVDTYPGGLRSYDDLDINLLVKQ